MGSSVLVRNLSVKEGEFEILSQINFELPENSFLSVLGPNGCGKTTLFKTLLGLRRASSGVVKLLGGEGEDLAPGLIGYVPQIKTLDRTFPALSVELVFTGLKRRWPWLMTSHDRNICTEALAQAGALHLAKREIPKLSGGELQRVYLARALVQKPRLVLLDEPATGIDPSGEDDLYHLLSEYQKNQGATILMVTHDLDVASHHSSHVLLLNHKQIGFGSPEVCLTHECLEELFGHRGHGHEYHGGHDHSSDHGHRGGRS